MSSHLTFNSDYAQYAQGWACTSMMTEENRTTREN